MYGPTENTTFSTYLPVTEFHSAAIPIGKPVANSTVYIVDKYNKLVPTGVPGELVVGGDGVARGYLNNPELTAEKFSRGAAPLTPLPLSPPSTPVYRTGDLSRWLPDGNIEFLGRIDAQVKIRGQRIELGEIEYHLLKHEDIKEAVVLAKENNDDKFLCAYIVAGKELEIPVLKGALSRRLPDFMVPSYFIPMESFPLTHTGKIDRNALPVPEVKASAAYEPPRDHREETLCKIWSEVLGLEKEKIGINDNFFEIGGNSINLIMLVGKINKEFGVDMPIPQIYQHPTIKEIAGDMVSMHYSDQSIVLLNRPKPRKIFGFPDQLGWGYGYGSLASILNDFSVYAFTFIEEEDRVNRYIDIIRDIQPHGPYVFFGHSAAGRLSFEVAKELENRGCEVSDIIFADCFILDLDAGGKESRREHTRFLVEEFLEQQNAEFLVEKILKKAISHLEYLESVPKLEIVNANIHLILSEEAQKRSDVDPRCWENLTAKTYRVYNGWGRHSDMLGGRDLEKNTGIIREILKT